MKLDIFYCHNGILENVGIPRGRLHRTNKTPIWADGSLAKLRIPKRIINLIQGISVLLKLPYVGQLTCMSLNSSKYAISVKCFNPDIRSLYKIIYIFFFFSAGRECDVVVIKSKLTAIGNEKKILGNRNVRKPHMRTKALRVYLRGSLWQIVFLRMCDTDLIVY